MEEIINNLEIIGTNLFEILKIQATYGRTILDVLHVVFENIFQFFLIIAFFVSLVYLYLSIRVIFSKDKDSEELKFIAKKAPTVTIQIPTRNEIIALRCVRKCLEFDYPKDKYDIIIGDDSDNPEVSKEISQFAAQYENITVLRREKNIGFKPGNLNNMLKHSKGDILVIFDSDFMPEKDFLKRLVTPFIYDDKISATQARWEFINPNKNLNTVLASSIQYVFHYVFLPFMKKRGNSSLCGSAEAVRKSHLIELGCWTSGSLTEDIEYSLRLHKEGKKIAYLPKLECYSEVPSTLKDLYKQQMRWAYGVITSYKVHFRSLLNSKNISFGQKMISSIMVFGYILPILILLLTVFGLLSVFTNAPAPIDIPRFLIETGKNILLTFGLIITTIFSLYKAKKLNLIWKMLISSFSVGLITTYYVNKGIFKAILNKPMNWFLLKKSTNYMKG